MHGSHLVATTIARADSILYFAGTAESLKVSERILISPPVTFGLNLRN
ncbi:hypothetical protein D1BOALGB6SA_4881 [Olavius sp. associated proteobacterium Delta 1]|nr:hypothetical protein D1BOALGB6SA_4881 [Olavius sp. associated proteobacterium Delta 1]